MDIFAQWNQRIREAPFPAGNSQESSIPEMVRDQLQKYMQLWWSCEQNLPVFSTTRLTRDHLENEKQLDRLVEGLVRELKSFPRAQEARQAWVQRMRPGLVEFARTTFRLEQRHVEFIESSGMLEASQEFARMARQFDPHISAEDIYQAGRNVMTANLMQLLLGLPVEVTPAVFAYSMLYPYTDNYLDDPAVSQATKLAFNHRFQRRLQGKEVQPANTYEAMINRLVGMIENQWNREQFPQVYESLLAIHAAQVRSLSLVMPGASPYELDVLGVSFEKGGTSVLADGYLVAGWLTPEQAAYMFGYGAYTQLMDDLEDIQQDTREGRMTIFSQTADHWPLDAVTNRFIHFGRAIFSDLNAFPSQATEPMKDIITCCLDPIVIDIIGREGNRYSKEYLREMERHAPFRFAAVRRQRDRLLRNKVSLGSLIDTLLVEDARGSAGSMIE